MNRILGVFLLSFLLINCGLVIRNNHLKEDLTRQQDNVEGLLSEITKLRDDSSMYAIQVCQLRLDIDDYERHRKADAEIIKNLNIKLKNVLSTSKQIIEVQAPVQTKVVHDTVWVGGKIVDVQNVHMEDAYIKVHGSIVHDTLKASVTVPITIHQVVHKVPKHKFLWWSWGCKAIKQAVYTDNPYVKIQYSEYIELN